MSEPITAVELPTGSFSAHTPMMAQYLRMTISARKFDGFGLNF